MHAKEMVPHDCHRLYYVLPFSQNNFVKSTLKTQLIDLSANWVLIVLEQGSSNNSHSDVWNQWPKSSIRRFYAIMPASFSLWLNFLIMFLWHDPQSAIHCLTFICPHVYPVVTCYLSNTKVVFYWNSKPDGSTMSWRTHVFELIK